MALRLSQCLGLLLLSLGLVSSAPAPSKSSAWDYFLFVEQSPAAFCYNKGSSCAYNSNITNWTMHGVWPTKNGTMGPNDCDPNATFKLEDIKELLPQMMRQWPNLKPKTSFDSFWSHEWLKHGTCASGIDCMSTEKGFFSTVLELHQTKMDFSAVLSSQGIYPSRDHTFKTTDFNNAFMNAMGVLPLLQCSYSKNKGQVLSQISVCLQKDFAVMQCPHDVYHSSSHKCWDNEEVHYIPNF